MRGSPTAATLKARMDGYEFKSAGLKPYPTKSTNLWGGVGAALQGWTIVVGAGVGRGRSFLLVGLLGARTQSRLAGTVVNCFAREHYIAQPGFHRIKFG